MNKNAIKTGHMINAVTLLKKGTWFLLGCLGVACSNPEPVAENRNLIQHENRYPNGVVRVKFQTLNGLKHDTVYEYDSAGKLSDKIPYREGSARGTASGYFADGSLRYLANYAHDRVNDRIVFNENGDPVQYRKWEKSGFDGGITLVQYIDFLPGGLPDLRKESCLYYRTSVRDTMLFVELLCPQNQTLKLVTGDLDSAFAPPKGTVPDTFNISYGKNHVRLRHPVTEKEFRCIVLVPVTQQIMQTGQTKTGYTLSYCTVRRE